MKTPIIIDPAAVSYTLVLSAHPQPATAKCKAALPTKPDEDKGIGTTTSEG